MSRDYLNVHANRWEGMEIFNIPKDGYGIQFVGGSRYVCFDNGELVGEFTTRSQAEAGFLRKTRVPDGVRKRYYLGISENLRTYVWKQ